MTTHQYPGSFQMPDPDMDCPNPACDGWLNLYGDMKNRKPLYFQCSNRLHAKLHLRCEQATIFSKRPGTCGSCKSPIALKDVITTNWDRTWIHLRCALTSNKPKDVFAMCLRCKVVIHEESDAVPSSTGGVSGFVHAACTKKRKSDDTDSEYTGSQQSSQESL